jgi:ADP-heptose:LPS heptosyltransferase
VTGTATERDLVARVVRTMRKPARPLVDALSLGGLAALYERCALVVANDTGPVHLAEAVDTPTVGIYWVGNFINGAPVDRTRHRPLLSWTLHCPECGVDCTTGRCPHSPSFVAGVTVADVVEAGTDLLGV